MKNATQTSIVFVAGATDFLGSEVCRQLREKDLQVKGLVRKTSDPEKVNRLVTSGVEVREGDLKDPASLEKALQGVSAVISTISSTFSRQEGDSIRTVDYEGQKNLINAARKAKVKKFIFISFCPMQGDFPLQRAKRDVAAYLRESGLNYTILQPTCFIDEWLSPALGMDYLNAKATIYGNGQKRTSWIAIKDVAAFAVAALEQEAARNRIIELGGPDALSPLEVVQIFEEQFGRKFELEFVPEENLRQQKETAQDPLQESFAALMLQVAKGSPVEMGETLAEFPIQLTSVKEFFSDQSVLLK